MNAIRSAAPFALAAAAALALAACTTTLAPKPAGEPPSADDLASVYARARASLAIQAPATRTAKDPLFLVHYMPWFQAPPVSDGYGFHWHMGGGKIDPYVVKPDGRITLASHYYPLEGPYDTRDPAVLEYQAALMKLSGVDGVIFDWYGIENALDYKEVQESTLAMVQVLKRAGLKFAVCYEDQSIGKMLEANAIPRADAEAAGKRVMDWMQANWFQDEAYVKFGGRPVLLNFGPQYYKDPRIWTRIWADVEPKPYFVSLDAHNEATSDGSYNWPPMFLSAGGKLSLPRLVGNLNEFYAKQAAKPYLVATAFPGFHDFYQDAGIAASYGYLDYGQGETFKLTLDAALAANPDVVQIATWNDYGEGTIVEPTIERGYAELEYVQQVQKKLDFGFGWSKEDLRAPIELLRAKAATGAAPDTRARVDAAYAALFTGDVLGYRKALKDLAIVPTLEVKPILAQPAASPAAAAGADAAAAVGFAQGKKNLALGKAIVASSKIYEFTGTKAVDGQVLTYWEGGANAYPNTLTVDLAASRNLAGIVLKLNPQKIWAKRVQTIEVQLSDDGEAFTVGLPAADYVFDPVAAANVVAVPLAAKARFVRLVITSNTQAKAGQVAEFEVYGE